jgi:hypothetical protein
VSLAFPVDTKLIREVYDPGFNFAGGVERRLSRSFALTGRAEYTGFPFDSGTDPFNYGQSVEAQAGQLNTFDGLLGVRLGPPALYGYVAAGGSFATGNKLQATTTDSEGNAVVIEYDPSGSGLAMRAGVGTTFGTKQRYDIELGWSMLQANDRIQSVVISTGVMLP